MVLSFADLTSLTHLTFTLTLLTYSTHFTLRTSRYLLDQVLGLADLTKLGLADGRENRHGEWRQLQAGGLAPKPAQGHSCVAHQDWILVFGGCGIDGVCFNTVHVLRADTGPAGRYSTFSVRVVYTYCTAG